MTHDATVDTEYLAKGTTGFTGADIENMVNQSALHAAQIGASAVNMKHLEYARDKVLMGPEKKTKITDQETNNITAYHEAGHTIVRYFTKEADPLHKVTIIPRGQALGFTAHIPAKEVYGRTRSQLLAEMDVMMGGRAAEEQIFGSDKVTTGAASDFNQATRLASNMVRIRRILITNICLHSIRYRLNSSACQTKSVLDRFAKRNKILALDLFVLMISVHQCKRPSTWR